MFQLPDIHQFVLTPFNRVYREAVLDAYLFFNLEEIRMLTSEWIEEYNHKRPHESLNNLTPNEWKMNLINSKVTLKNDCQRKGVLTSELCCTK